MAETDPSINYKLSRTDRDLLTAIRSGQNKKRQAMTALRIRFNQSRRNTAYIKQTLNSLNIQQLSNRSQEILSQIQQTSRLRDELQALDPEDDALVILNRTIQMMMREHKFVSHRLRGGIEDYNNVNRNIANLTDRIVKVKTRDRQLNVSIPSDEGSPITLNPDYRKTRPSINTTRMRRPIHPSVSFNSIGNMVVTRATVPVTGNPSQATNPSLRDDHIQYRRNETDIRNTTEFHQWEQKFFTDYQKDRNKNFDEVIKALKGVKNRGTGIASLPGLKGKSGRGGPLGLGSLLESFGAFGLLYSGVGALLDNNVLYDTSGDVANAYKKGGFGRAAAALLDPNLEKYFYSDKSGQALATTPQPPDINNKSAIGDLKTPEVNMYTPVINKSEVGVIQSEINIDKRIQISGPSATSLGGGQQSGADSSSPSTALANPSPNSSPSSLVPSTIAPPSPTPPTQVPNNSTPKPTVKPPNISTPSSAPITPYDFSQSNPSSQTQPGNIGQAPPTMPPTPPSPQSKPSASQKGAPSDFDFSKSDTSSNVSSGSMSQIPSTTMGNATEDKSPTTSASKSGDLKPTTPTFTTDEKSSSDDPNATTLDELEVDPQGSYETRTNKDGVKTRQKMSETNNPQPQLASLVSYSPPSSSTDASKVSYMDDVGSGWENLKPLTPEQIKANEEKDSLSSPTPKTGEDFSDYLKRRVENDPFTLPLGRSETEADTSRKFGEGKFNAQDLQSELDKDFADYSDPTHWKGRYSRDIDSGKRIEDSQSRSRSDIVPDEFTPSSKLSLGEIKALYGPNSNQDISPSVSLTPQTDSSSADRIPYTPRPSQSDNSSSNISPSTPDTSVPGNEGGGSATNDNTVSSNQQSVEMKPSTVYQHRDLGLVQINGIDM